MNFKPASNLFVILTSLREALFMFKKISATSVAVILNDILI